NWSGAGWGKKTRAVTVPQMRAIFSLLLRRPAPTPAQVARTVSRVLRRKEESRIYHWLQATGKLPPRRPRPASRARGKPTRAKSQNKTITQNRAANPKPKDRDRWNISLLLVRCRRNFGTVHLFVHKTRARCPCWRLCLGSFTS